MRYLALALCLIPSLAFGQASVRQDGAVTKNNLSKWSSDHIAKDVGGLQGDLSGQGANPFAVTDNDGPGICFYSGPIVGTNPIPSQICIGHASDGSIALTVQGAGGANVGCNWTINGSTYACATTGGGNVTGPNSAVDGQLAIYNGATGKLIRNVPTLALDTTSSSVNCNPTNGCLISGDTTPRWFDTFWTYGHAPYTGISAIGGGGVLGACRTSDAPSGVNTCLPIYGLSSNDYTGSTSRPSWGAYFESRRYTGAGIMLGMEIDATNLGTETVTDVNPYSEYPNNAGGSVLHLGPGGGCRSATPCYTPTGARASIPVSADITIVNQGTTANTGINIGCDALTGGACGAVNLVHAMKLPAGAQIEWWTGSGPTMNSYIRSDQGAPGNVMGINFTSSPAKIGFYDSSGVQVASVGVGGFGVFGTQSGASAELGGIEIFGNNAPGIQGIGTLSGFLPTSATTSWAIGDNLSNANSEVDIFNTDNAGGGFDLRQKTAAGTAVSLLRIFGVGGTLGGFKYASYPVGSLPPAAANADTWFYVNDLNAPTYNAVAAGGSTGRGWVVSDGTNWRVH